MRFAKYQGIGNDFVMIADPGDRVGLTPELVRRLCDRRFGIGGDGVIRVSPGRDGAELFMDYVNSDGSIGEMCGNGIRCLALFARAEGLTGATELSVATRAGVKFVEVLGGDRVRVDMGPPVFAPADIPVHWEGRDALEVKIQIESGVVEAACLSMGNPHAVLFVDDPAAAPVATLGPALEAHPDFPKRTNVEFVTVLAEDRIAMRVWERGVGETLACGTGACAAAVASKLLAGTSSEAVVALPGGELEISWAGSLEERASVLLTGPAVRAFSGEIEVGV
ncbi:MAG: diaminopimelate epimerase [Actinomycetota bacterium]